MPLPTAIRILIALLAIAPASAGAPTARTDTPSGLPVPRYVGVKYDKAHCRAGPSFLHPAVVTFVRRGLPLLVIAETIDHWRKVRDIDGIECWMHKSTLRAPTHAITLVETDLKTSPERTARLRARLGPGVVAKIERKKPGWRKISAEGVGGWAEIETLWGTVD